MKLLFISCFIVLLSVNGCNKNDVSTNPFPPTLITYSMTGEWDVDLQGQITFHEFMNMTEKGDSLMGTITIIDSTATFDGLITDKNKYTLQTGQWHKYYYFIANGTVNSQKDSMSGTIDMFRVGTSNNLSNDLGYYSMTCTKRKN